MKKKIVSIITAVLILAMAASVFVGCGTKETIKIGVIFPLSGQLASIGVQTRDAIQMAADEINQNGGILGRQVELVIEDDEAKPEKAVTSFTKLVTQDKVVSIIGSLTSGCTLAIANEAQSRNIVLISPSATNDSVTSAGDYIFRACYNDSFQGQIMAKYALQNLKYKNTAILYDNTNDYSRGLRDNYKSYFEQQGGTIVAEESYATNDTSFSAQLTKIKAKNPDAIFIPDYYSADALIAKQARKLGITAPFLGGDGWDPILTVAGDEVLGTYYSNHYASDSPDTDVQGYVSRFNAKYNQTPGSISALAYDSLYMLTDAMTRANSTDSTKVRPEVAATNKKFVTGNIKFDANRNPIKSVVIIKVTNVDGQLKSVYTDTVNP